MTSTTISLNASGNFAGCCAGVATVSRSLVIGNRKNGILAREDSQIYVRDSEIAKNLECGILLKVGAPAPCLKQI